jgi:O-antigen/teichoic acid export membrane protein
MIAMRQAATQPIVSGSVALVGARLISIVAGLVAVSIVVRSLDQATFGFWSALASLTTLTAGLDLGIGSAVRNRIAALRAAGDEAGAHEALGAAVLMIGLLSAVLAGLALSAAVVVRVMGLATWSSEQLQAIVVTVVCLGAFQVGNLAQVALYARERLALVAALEVGRWAITIPALLLVASAGGGLMPVTAVYFVALALSVLAAFPLLRANGHWGDLPSAARAWLVTKRDIWTGIGFASLQVVATLVYQTDVLAAAQLTSLAEAGNFALVQRLYLVPFTLMFAAATPLWARTSAEVALGNHHWARSVAARGAVAAAGVALVGGTVIALAGPSAVGLWAGREVRDVSLYLGLAAWLVVAVWVMVLSVVLNGMGRVWPQVRWLSVAMVVKVVFAWLLVERLGIAALAWGAAVALLPLAWANWREVQRSLSQDERVAREVRA